MPRIGYCLIVAALALLLGAADEPPASLRRGINITHWFRFPPSHDPAALRSYLDDAELDELKRAGFTFLRIPVQPEFLGSRDALADAVSRIQRHGLAAVVSLFWTGRRVETDPAVQAKLLETWRRLAVALERLDQRKLFPEILNEPVFASDPGSWRRLQHQAVITIRPILPASTIVLSGADWGGIDGLLSLLPEPDPNVVYSFHFYEPAELTALGAYRPSLDTGSLARLPFPASDETACRAAADAARDPATASVMRFYCAQRWDASKVDARIAEAGSWARRYHVAVLAGEFGASRQLDAPARLAWLRAVREACERQQVGWSLWGYDDSMGFGLHPPHYPQALDPATLRALGLEQSGIRVTTPPPTRVVTSP